MIVTKQTNLVLCKTDKNVVFSISNDNYKKMSEETIKTIENDVLNTDEFTSINKPIHVILIEGVPFYI